MRRQICRVIIALGCLAGLSGAAMASPFSCLPGSFLSTLDAANFSTPTGPYGEVCVTLIDSTHALIQAETFSPFVMFGAQALDLNVNSTTFIIVGGDAGITGGTSPTRDVAGTADGFGNFTLRIDNFDGPGSGTSFFSFTLENSSGTWANVSSVLIGNASGNDAAIHVASGDTGLGFAAEAFTNGGVIPQPAPEPGMLGLLGIGLLAMSLPALRRRKA